MFGKAAEISKTITIGMMVLTIYYLISTSIPRQDNVNDIVNKLNHLNPLDLARIHEVMNGLVLIKPDMQIEKRDDNEKEQQNTGPTKPLDIAGVRVLLAFGAILAINLLAITVHHIYLKLSRSEKSYRTIEHNLSPF